MVEPEGSGIIKPDQVAVGKGSVTVNGQTTTDGSFTTLTTSRFEYTDRSRRYVRQGVISYMQFPKPGTNVEIKEYLHGQLYNHVIVRPRPISAAIAFPADGSVRTGGLTTTNFVREGVVVSFTVSGGIASDYGDRLILQIHGVDWEIDFGDGSAELARLAETIGFWRVEARSVP